MYEENYNTSLKNMYNQEYFHRKGIFYNYKGIGCTKTTKSNDNEGLISSQIFVFQLYLVRKMNPVI